MHLPLPRLHALLVLTALVLGLVTPARAQTAAPCFDPAEGTPEGYGPTDISAVSGNGRMSVALNPDATVTVLKWPSPSFYDQIKYRTTDRRRPRMGARPNEGAFIGIAHRTSSSGWKFSWLRNWSSHQSFKDDDTDVVRTTFRRRSAGLTVRVTDVVRADLDALYRNVVVSRTPNSNVRKVRVIAFANFNPVFSKTAQSPTDDWCTEEDNDDGADYIRERDAIIHVRSGTDASTGDPSSVGVAMGFARRSDGHQVGTDSYAGNGNGGSAYDSAADGRLSGRRAVTGQADAALADDIDLSSRLKGSTTVILAASVTRKTTLETLDEARFMDAGRVNRRKDRYWRAWLRTAPLPRNAPKAVTELAKRSLITLRQSTDSRTNMIVASIATQSPYGLDWIRDGLYANRALDVAGRDAFTVHAHNLRYGQLQARTGEPPPGGAVIPAGNWAQNYYADGVVGGPIPYEIDETGYGIFTLWDHYARTGDRDYLVQAAIYEAIQRAAHYLSEDPPFGCTDPVTNLQCPANEGDNEDPSQTLVGAQAVWLGLDAAVRAAEVRGGTIADQNIVKWGDRQTELRAAIDANFFDEDCRCYTRDHEVGGALLWPVGMLDYGSTRSDRQADINWRHMQRVFSGKTKRGRLEAKMLLGNAFAWKGTPQIKKARRGLNWVARVPTTNETGLLGEAWMVFPKGGPVTTMVSQPHTPSHAMFYLAALQAYGTKRYSFD